MIELQYDLFSEQLSEIDELKIVCASLKESQDKQRKALFAKMGAYGKDFLQMSEELHRLKFELDAVRKMIASN